MAFYNKINDNIYSINTGIGKSFLIKSGKNILIDTGDNAHRYRLLDFLRLQEVIDSLDYIFITHAHHDHCGGLEIVSRETKAKIVIFSPDDIALKAGQNCDLIPYGLKGKIASIASAPQVYNWSNVPDIVLTDDTWLDDDKTIKAVSLAGHTRGSGGILFDKHLFCGDLFMSFGIPHFGSPFFVYDENVWKESCKKALSSVNIILPSHGRVLNVFRR